MDEGASVDLPTEAGTTFTIGRSGGSNLVLHDPALTPGFFRVHGEHATISVDERICCSLWARASAPSSTRCGRGSIAAEPRRQVPERPAVRGACDAAGAERSAGIPVYWMSVGGGASVGGGGRATFDQVPEKPTFLDVGMWEMFDEQSLCEGAGRRRGRR